LIYLTKIFSKSAAKVFFGCFVTTKTLKNDVNLREVKTIPQVDRSTHKPTPVGGEEREYF